MATSTRVGKTKARIQEFYLAVSYAYQSPTYLGASSTLSQVDKDESKMQQTELK